MCDQSEDQRPIVVHYTRYWLPSPVDEVESLPKNVDTSRVTEVVLEPQVLWFCLLRKATNLRFIMVPEVYDRFAGGPMPAAYVEDEKCFSGEPLRQEQLMEHIFLSSIKSPECKQELLNSTFSLFESENGKNGAENDVGTESTQQTASILPVYVEKHLRYAVLYLIWVHPTISHNVTKRIVINSMPRPHGHITYYRKSREIANECFQCGYSNLDFTMKELKLMLQELQRMLRKGSRQFNHRPGYWMEGSIFANLSVLFSIPCQGIEELLVLHKEFYDLKAYCVMVNRAYNVVDLKPPFLCGNTFSLNHFVKRPCPLQEWLSYIWETIKNSQLFSFIYQRENTYEI